MTFETPFHNLPSHKAILSPLNCGKGKFTLRDGRVLWNHLVSLTLWLVPGRARETADARTRHLVSRRSCGLHEERTFKLLMKMKLNSKASIEALIWRECATPRNS